jgi:nicotinate phosphoribosyltransferase
MIIRSLIDTDLYKLTMCQAVIKLYPRAKVRYSFINRANTVFPDGFAEKLRKEIKEMETLSLTKEEKDFIIKKSYFFDPTFLDFLQGYKFDSSEVGIIQNEGSLEISIEGYWYRTILWEVPLMALISELYFKETKQVILPKEKRHDNNFQKAKLFQMNNMIYTDFGTRRRFSYENQDEVINDFVNFSLNNKSFIGTSNVHFAHKYNLKFIGTHAHEWFSYHAALYGYTMANVMALDNWANVYRGDLGTALADTFTSDVFFKAFDKKLAKLYDGVRHDSGDPIEFAKKTILHYEKMAIDPLSKTIIFSDGLNPVTALTIHKFCENKIKCSFGIGTNFTNDVGVTPLNIVIKMVAAKIDEDWVPTIKLSDIDGKHTGHEKEINICKHILRIP